MEALNNLSDAELVDLLKLGDRAAYTEIYDRYIFVLLNHAYNKTRNREEAKDDFSQKCAKCLKLVVNILYPQRNCGKIRYF
jgi:hypothetical protein